jgi:hypothetical protein
VRVVRQNSDEEPRGVEVTQDAEREKRKGRWAVMARISELGRVLDKGEENRITDDEILSIWRTVRPSAKQNEAMTYASDTDDLTCPMFELRRLVELAIEYALNRRNRVGHLTEQRKEVGR